MPLPKVPLLVAAASWVKEAATGVRAGWRAFFFLKRVAIDDWSWAEGAEMFLIYLDYSPDTLAEIKYMGLVVLGGVLAFLVALAAIAYFVWRRKSSAIMERVTALAGRNTVLNERNADLTERNIFLDGRSTFLSWRNTFLAGRNTSLSGRITVLVERNAVLTWCKTYQAERHASLAVRNSVLTERNNVLTGSNAMLTERNAELTGYLNDAEETISIILEKGWLVPPDSMVSTSSRSQHGATRAAFQSRGDATKLGTGEKKQVEGIDNLGTGGTDSTNAENGSPRRAASSGNGHGGHRDNTRCKERSSCRSSSGRVKHGVHHQGLRATASEKKIAPTLSTEGGIQVAPTTRGIAAAAAAPSSRLGKGARAEQDGRRQPGKVLGGQDCPRTEHYRRTTTETRRMEHMKSGVRTRYLPRVLDKLSRHPLCYEAKYVPPRQGLRTAATEDGRHSSHRSRSGSRSYRSTRSYIRATVSTEERVAREERAVEGTSQANATYS